MQLVENLKNNRLFNQEAVNSMMDKVGQRLWSNCWGTTLWTLGAMKDLIFVNESTMLSWIEANTMPIETPEVGDILVIHFGYTPPWATNTLMHTAIYIGNDLYWHQAGHGGTFHIDSLDGVLRIYNGTFNHVRVKEEFAKVA